MVVIYALLHWLLGVGAIIGVAAAIVFVLEFGEAIMTIVFIFAIIGALTYGLYETGVFVASFL